MRKKCLVVYGGKSVEHDISVITALQAVRFLPKNYEPILVYIDKNGIWWVGDNLSDLSIYQNFRKYVKGAKQVTFLLGEKILLAKKKNKFVHFCDVGVVLNCCHGRVGEDGCLSGIFEACEVPCSASGVMSAAVCMDKVVMKDILKANNIQTPEYVYFNKCSYDRARVLKHIKFPLIVKPANLGSSIGISVCHDEGEFDDAVELAFSFDTKVLVEKLVENLREFNCACFRFHKEYFVSSAVEVTKKDEIFTFENKYIQRGGANKEVERALARKVKALTEQVYKILDCKGVVRVDFLYDEAAKTLFVNEVNTIPGSLAFYLFKEIKFPEILDAILTQSEDEMEEKENLITTFDSDAIRVFQDFSESVKK